MAKFLRRGIVGVLTALAAFAGPAAGIERDAGGLAGLRTIESESLRPSVNSEIYNLRVFGTDTWLHPVIIVDGTVPNFVVDDTLGFLRVIYRPGFNLFGTGDDVLVGPGPGARPVAPPLIGRSDGNATYQQEFLGGIEFEVARSVSLGVRYVHRSTPPVPVVDTAEGWLDRALKAIGQQPVGPNGSPIVPIVPIYLGEDWVVAPGPPVVGPFNFGGPVAVPNSYDSVEVTLNKNFSDNWGLVTSYRNARAFSAPGTQYVPAGDPSITSLFDFPAGTGVKYLPSVALLPGQDPPPLGPRPIQVIRPTATEPGVIFAGEKAWAKLSPDAQHAVTVSLRKAALDDARKKIAKEKKLREDLKKMGVPVVDPPAQ